MIAPDSPEVSPEARRGWTPRHSASVSDLADLDFGSLSQRQQAVLQAGRHLVLLPSEALVLDLDDPQQREFGDYALLEQLGQGGMGVVYRARQGNLDREVALKLLSAGPWATDDFIAGFQREARNTASLRHPNIVTVFDTGTQDDLHYYTMQLVRGPSLAQKLAERGRFASDEAVSMVRRIAEGVDYAHRLGVLHLDLKPGNVLIDVDGEPRIADFGLARRIDPVANRDNERIAGTPSYMAPEQAQIGSGPLTPAADVWALGAILYEMLCGQPPFDTADAGTTLLLLQTGVVRRLSRLTRLSPDLEAICLKCLAKSANDRYPSARALADDLGRYLEGRPVSVRPLGALQRVMRWARLEPSLAVTARRGSRQCRDRAPEGKPT